MKRETFLEKLYECDQHKKRLLIAKEYLGHVMPLDVEKYKALNEVEMSFIDQMIYRFSKLQDTMGEKIFSNILELTGEDVKKMTFIDRVNRLEELGLLYKEEWMKLRKYRNEIAHEYSFNKEEIVDSINVIYQKVDDLIRIYENIYNYCRKQFDFIPSSFEE